MRLTRLLEDLVSTVCYVRTPYFLCYHHCFLPPFFCSSVCSGIWTIPSPVLLWCVLLRLANDSCAPVPSALLSVSAAFLDSLFLDHTVAFYSVKIIWHFFFFQKTKFCTMERCPTAVIATMNSSGRRVLAQMLGTPEWKTLPFINKNENSAIAIT